MASTGSAAITNNTGELARVDSDSFDLPPQLDSGCRLDPLAHSLTELFDVVCRGVAGVDQEVAMHFGDLRTTELETTAAGGVDQLPGRVSRRILEGRAAG